MLVLEESRLESKRRTLSALILVSAILVTVVLICSRFLGASVPSVSAVTVEQDIGVYWERDCVRSVSWVDWGRLSPGQVRNVVVYVRNEGNETFVLVLTALNWSPENASRHFSLALNCEDSKIEAGQVADVTLSLSVSLSVTGVHDFGFNMALEGREFFLGDLDRNGSVSLFDILIMKAAMGSTPTYSNWNPKADLDKNGIINLFDYLRLQSDFGQSW